MPLVVPGEVLARLEGQRLCKGCLQDTNTGVQNPVMIFIRLGFLILELRFRSNLSTLALKI